MPRWLVDASNVLGSRPDGWWRDRTGALARLLDEVVRWRAEVGEPVTLVCDGWPSGRVPEATVHGVEVRFARSRARDAADDLLVRLLDEGSSPEEVVVATSDRALRARAEARGADVEGAKTFLQRLEDAAGGT